MALRLEPGQQTVQHLHLCAVADCVFHVRVEDARPRAQGLHSVDEPARRHVLQRGKALASRRHLRRHNVRRQRNHSRMVAAPLERGLRQPPPRSALAHGNGRGRCSRGDVKDESLVQPPLAVEVEERLQRPLAVEDAVLHRGALQQRQRLHNAQAAVGRHAHACSRSAPFSVAHDSG